MENNWLIFFNKIKEKVINSNEVLNESELTELKVIIEKINKSINISQMDLMNLGRLLDYNDLKQKGKTKDEIKCYYNEDEEALERANKTFEENISIDHSQMFGYPANMKDDSYLISYFRWLESKMYFMNSCGDAYHPGNYRMNNASTEISIIEEIKDNLNLPKDKYWGYVNAGGTEGNFWGIREGISKYSDGVVYYSDSSHYSVNKFTDMISNIKNEKITSHMGEINKYELLEKIKQNYFLYKYPAIILLTCGTTALGSIDDIVYIKNELLKLNIPHYIHLDAAMYGGIPKNQINSPISELLENMPKLDLDSISISLHKYIGNSRVNGVIIAKTQTNENFIDYIGQRDVTFLGSRDFAAFSTLQRLKESNKRSDENEYYKNIEIFENLLIENNISFIKGNKYGNTFIIDKTNDEICKKYQLATFKYEEKECAHIIIFPYHKLEDMKNLVYDINNQKNKIKNKIR